MRGINNINFGCSDGFEYPFCADSNVFVEKTTIIVHSDVSCRVLRWLFACLGTAIVSLCCDRHRDLLLEHGIMKVKILQWHTVASWTWDAHDDPCGICRMAFDGCCPDYKMPGNDCLLMWGACNLAFHLHCILKWVKSQSPRPQCPMCRRDWKFRGD